MMEPHYLCARKLIIFNITQAIMENEFFIGGTKYRINSDGSSVTLIRCQDDYTGMAIVPNCVEYEGIEYEVTKIGAEAFEDCCGLTNVKIPESVTEIKNLAFNGCNGLTSIVVDSGNTIYDSRNGCNAIIETATNTLIVGCKSTVIPSSVTKVGDFAFNGCSDLTSVVIPDSVAKIGGWAFNCCRNLTSVVIPDSVTWIGPCAFSGTPWERRMRQIVKK